jgi:hypothetical protein
LFTTSGCLGLGSLSWLRRGRNILLDGYLLFLFPLLLQLGGLEAGYLVNIV